LYGITLLALSNFHYVHRMFKPYAGIYLYNGIGFTGAVLLIVPFFGLLRYESLALTYAYRYIPYWACNYALIVFMFTAKIIARRVALDKRSVVVDKMIPFLLIAALYTLVVPQRKPSFLINLIPLIMISFMHWYYSRSRVFLNGMIVYCILWLPFFLVDWNQTLLVFILELACGAFCYMLGSFYQAKYNARAQAILFKVFGLLIFFSSCYVVSFQAVGRVFSRGFKFPSLVDFWLLFSAAYLGILVLYRALAPLKYPRHKHGLLPEEQYLVTFLPFAAPLLLIAIASRSVDFWYTFGTNTLYLGILVAFIAVGYRRNELYTKALAFSFLVLLVLSRYLELEWSLFYKAVLFIVTGIFILVIGIFAEKHKHEAVVIEK
ncbi:MAG: hypothetical protein KKF80_06175, partial [Candidatus Omnitrophica bacterium]|nr:hypothetical protein [Candidatus Omnitrophota bacterium]